MEAPEFWGPGRAGPPALNGALQLHGLWASIFIFFPLQQAAGGLKMAAVDLSKLVKEKRFWVASFLVAYYTYYYYYLVIDLPSSAADSMMWMHLQGHMMWMQRQDAFKHKFSLDQEDADAAAPSSDSSSS
ncbi:hypothetical protein HU200_012718 [Digitaria exilis]|uniref:Uncharacterized protein n=1 Tax=Digitaria exilis TaxID=1010633 RepID=A0A835KLM6_9POAL|nr:hypothetical protein HU200_012718 [Digitaria exilis]